MRICLHVCVYFVTYSVLQAGQEPPRVLQALAVLGACAGVGEPPLEGPLEAVALYTCAHVRGTDRKRKKEVISILFFRETDLPS